MRDMDALDGSVWGRALGLGSQPAIMVIDLTRAFTEPPRPLATDVSALIDPVNRIIAAGRAARLPIIFTSVSYDAPDLSDAGLWGQKIGGQADLMAGGSGVDIDPRLDHQPQDLILVKKYASCFFGTDLSSRLCAGRRDGVILTGVTTSGCVRATAVDAIQSGFRPTVVSDAVGDRWSDAHDQSLKDMAAKYADVLTSAEVLKRIAALAG